MPSPEPGFAIFLHEIRPRGSEGSEPGLSRSQPKSGATDRAEDGIGYCPGLCLGPTRMQTALPIHLGNGGQDRIQIEPGGKTN
jgi:hypothetical protein